MTDDEVEITVPQDLEGRMKRAEQLAISQGKAVLALREELRDALDFMQALSEDLGQLESRAGYRGRSCVRCGRAHRNVDPKARCAFCGAPQ